MPTQVERRTGTRQAIVDAALAIFLEDDGIDASLDAIAERAGVAKSTVIYHFGGRQGVLQAVADHLFRMVGAQLAPWEQYPDAPAFVRALLQHSRSQIARIQYQVGDHLLYRTDHDGLGFGIQAVIDALAMYGDTARPVVKAAAILMMARQAAFVDLDEAALDRFVDELFA